ncbi:HU family DNA-binding protein [Oceaniglobus indicus]|uniref:HU family DNA-binding protein n=1 Tax=Oceaniglobus indicus TaxID=2047749 RepID=UPI001F4E177E|nr:HU family DNA-binding protein [Oceaniglobus indicus]
MQDEFDPDATTADSPMTLVAEVSPVVADAPLKKPDLIEQVAATSGLKKKDAKAAVEATLAALGQALADGREMNLPPFGKLAVNRTKVKSNGTVTIARIRQPSAMPKPDDPLASAEKDV